jgi:hypothetical protein
VLLADYSTFCLSLAVERVVFGFGATGVVGALGSALGLIEGVELAEQHTMMAQCRSRCDAGNAIAAKVAAMSA